MRGLPLIVCLTLGQAGWAATLAGKVVGLSDGDTLTILDAAKTQHVIRLAGIDAPEKAQPFGQRAKEHLSGLVFGKQVTIEGDKIDRYQRRVGKVIVNGVDANLEQVKAGFAWHYKTYAKEQSPGDRDKYAAAEDAARAQRVGLWRDAKPVPPWEWRQNGKGQPSARKDSEECPCGSGNLCTGNKGGTYCVMPSGKKKYQ